jgi:hypothetical protein
MKNRVIVLFLFSFLSLIPFYAFSQAYVIPHFTNEKPGGNSENSEGERVGNISAEFGLGEDWTFVFYYDGSFESREWYGPGQKWARPMRRIVEYEGTYYITKDQKGKKTIHLQYSNGKERDVCLRYEGNRAIVSYDNKAHKEIQ